MTDREVHERLFEALSVLPGGPVVVPVDLTRRAVRHQRRRRASAVGVAALAAIAIAVPVSLVTSSSKPSIDPTTSRGPMAEQLSHATWSAIPDAPIRSRQSPAVAWTGSQMLVWGGVDLYGKAFADGAAYDPTTRTWTKLPPSPLSARSDAASVWTGTEWFVWGGRSGITSIHDDGAAYNPATRNWRRLPPSPLQSRVGATAVLVDGKVLVFGGIAPNRGPSVIGLYDPATNTWRSLATLPAVPTHDYFGLVAGVQQGDRVRIEVPWSSQHQSRSVISSDGGIEQYLLDPRTGKLLAAPEDKAAPRGLGTLLWTGSEVLSAATGPYLPSSRGPRPSGLRGARYDVTTGHWSAIAHGPVDDLMGASVWTGAALLTFDTSGAVYGGDLSEDHSPGEAAAWDPKADRWYSVPRAPAVGASAWVWTGRQLLEWGFGSASVTQGLALSLPGGQTADQLVDWTDKDFGFSLRHPLTWSAYPFTRLGTFGGPVGYLSTEPLHDTCARPKPAPDCGAKLLQGRLARDGVLITVSNSGSPSVTSISKFPGTDTTVGGSSARFEPLSDATGQCLALKGTKQLGGTVLRPDAPDNFLHITACFGQGAPADASAQAEALFRSIRFTH